MLLQCVEGHEVAMLTIKTFESLRTDDNFKLFWLKVQKRREQLHIDEPKLLRRRKVPRRFEPGDAPAEFPASPKDEFRRVYFESLNLAITSIRSRFDQESFKTFSNVEQPLLKACAGKCFKEELDAVCAFFYEDFSR